MWDLLKFKANVALVDADGNNYSYATLHNASKELAAHVPARCLVFCFCSNTVGSVLGYVSFLNDHIVPLMLDEHIDRSLLENFLTLYRPDYLWLPDAAVAEFEGAPLYSAHGYTLLKRADEHVYRLHDDLALLLTSLVFYGWGEPIYISIMVLSILIDYTHGLLVEKYRSRDKLARWFVAESVLLNLGLLGFFKYWDFFAANLSLIPGISIPALGLPLPIGISFFTFQTMSYTIDVYRQDAPAQRNMVSFGAYVTMFPQLVAGPIVR